MDGKTCSLLLLLLLSPFFHQAQTIKQPVARATKIVEIKAPDGFYRTLDNKHEFSSWLRALPLKSDPTVYLYNGQKKVNQGAQYAVIDLPVGKRDLQQCADAVMRLRASWLFNEKRFEEIRFSDNDGRSYSFQPPYDDAHFGQYLEKIYAHCGTASLARQLKPVAAFRDIRAGDVIIRGGFPGHAVIVVDICQNKMGEKLFMLAQSYMPAQEIHILKNPLDQHGDPWFTMPEENRVITPEYIFRDDELKRW